MFANKTKPTTPQIRALSLDELEHVSGGVSAASILAHAAITLPTSQGHIS